MEKEESGREKKGVIDVFGSNSLLGSVINLNNNSNTNNNRNSINRLNTNNRMNTQLNVSMNSLQRNVNIVMLLILITTDIK